MQSAMRAMPVAPMRRVSRISDWMSHALATVLPSETVARARLKMRLFGVPHLVVCEGGNVSGLVSERDLGRAEDDAIARVMSPAVLVVPRDATLSDVERAARGRTLSAIVVVHRDRVVGVVTMARLLHELARAGHRE